MFFEDPFIGHLSTFCRLLNAKVKNINIHSVSHTNIFFTNLCSIFKTKQIEARHAFENC
jgi:hypothetical protein